MLESLIEPSRQTPVLGEYDVVVLGGGPAGIAAAVAAARLGNPVLLVERYGFLGGMGTAAGVTNFCGLHANVHGEIRQVVHGVADDLLSRIAALGGLNDPHNLFGKTAAQAYDTAAYKIAADDLMLSAGVQVLFHALAAGVVMEAPERVRALLIETKSGRRAVLGRAFIDCSGDGDLAAWAGAAYEKGDGRGNMLYPSTMFRINGIDPVRAGKAWEAIPGLMHASRSARPLSLPAQDADRAAAKERHRMARQPDAAGQRPRATPSTAPMPLELSEAEVLGRRQIASVAGFLGSAGIRAVVHRRHRAASGHPRNAARARRAMC